MKNSIVIPEIKISIKFSKKIPVDSLITITGAESAAAAFRQIFDADTICWREEMLMLCLNQANKVVGFYKVSSGGMTGTVADSKIIMTIALQSVSTSIIIAHNHPSGNLKPSSADIDLTKKIKAAGELLDIKLLDHLIITDESFISFTEEGII